MTKVLTKSLFTTALECPRKLYYAVHGNEYDNANSDNDFLRSLAEGGIQVGALARHLYQTFCECGRLNNLLRAFSYI